MSTHLRYCLYGASDAKERRHPQIVMRALGITWQHFTPQSLGEQWWFWNCENLPDPLPPYLTPLNITPHRAVGHGLSAEDADRIAAHDNTEPT